MIRVGKRGYTALALCIVSLLLLAQVAFAGELDLLTLGSSGYLNGAYFLQIDPLKSTGTGVLNSFVRIQKNSVEQGYNTDNSKLEFDEKVGSWTHSLLLSDVPVVTVNGVQYRQFVLDINENTGSNNQYLSLDKMQIFLGSAGNLTGYASGLGTKVWDLDLGVDGDSWLKLDYSLAAGSGNGDMYAYVPNSVFQGPNQYVYLFSQFGAQAVNGLDSSDGFEEWAVQKSVPSTPEPGSILALSLGVMSLGLKARRMRR